MTTDPLPTAPRRRRPARAVLVGLALLVALSAASCASDPPSPAQQRKDRVEARLDASFSKAQSDCILKVLKPSTIAALDRDATLPKGDDLDVYTAAVVACVGGG